MSGFLSLFFQLGTFLDILVCLTKQNGGLLQKDIEMLSQITAT